nr:hypothetical protein [Clostridia bacterium]
MGIIAAIAGTAAFIWLFNLITTKILKHISPERSIRTLCECVMQAMQDAGLISRGVRLVVDGVKTGVFIHIELVNASVHDQNLFHTAVAQMLSPIESPRYLFIPKRKSGGLNYRYALACPEILGSKREYAELLTKRLEKSIGRIATVYTRTENGRKLIMNCRIRSYISENEAAI